MATDKTTLKALENTIELIDKLNKQQKILKGHLREQRKQAYGQ